MIHEDQCVVNLRRMGVCTHNLAIVFNSALVYLKFPRFGQKSEIYTREQVECLRKILYRPHINLTADEAPLIKDIEDAISYIHGQGFEVSNQKFFEFLRTVQIFDERCRGVIG